MIQKLPIITNHPFKNKFMKTAKTLQLFCLLSCCLFGQLAFGQTPNLVKGTNIEAGEATVGFNADIAFLIEISGPIGYYPSLETATSSKFLISPTQADGIVFVAGSLQMQLTPVYYLTEAQHADIIILRENNDEAGIAAYRATHDLPAEANVYVVNYGIRAGKFVASSKEEGNAIAPRFAKTYQVPPLANSLVSLTYFEESYEPKAMDRTNMAED